MSAVPTARPKRHSRPSAKLLDSNNAATPEISAHALAETVAQPEQHAAADAPANQAPSATTPADQDVIAAEPPSQPSVTADDQSEAAGETGTSHIAQLVCSSQSATSTGRPSNPPKRYHKVTVIEIQDEDDNTTSDVSDDPNDASSESSGESEVSEPATSRKRKKSQRRKRSKARKRQKKTDHGPSDIEVQVMDIDSPILSVRRDKSKDVDRFFSPAYTEGGKKLRNCRKCRYANFLRTHSPLSY